MTDVHLFVGPSALGLKREIPPDVRTHPPARRGSVRKLVEESDQPGVIALADGTFHSYPAVGHRELNEALEGGWEVWGLCSMGAIRASEMSSVGMRGYGVVYGMFAEDPDFADDEVALVHGLEAPFRAVSEPMVHIRAYLRSLEEAGILSPVKIGQVLIEFKERWYAERTLPALAECLAAQGYQDSIADMRAFDRFRIKTHDLESFLTGKPWTLKEAQV
ncbi:TfuA-like protein [Streptomyces roseus]|uniref:TfuA-like protein n=1 Tax=Streptomyces roseus TaxID=66430 RepID=UPI00381B3FF4